MTDDDFVLLPVPVPVDGPPRYGRRNAGESTSRAIRRHVPDLDTLGTQGLGRLRVWFADTFGPDLRPNPLADQVIGRLGYEHPTGWYGPVALSMEEDATGETPALAPEVRATVDELAGAPQEDEAGEVPLAIDVRGTTDEPAGPGPEQ